MLKTNDLSPLGLIYKLKIIKTMEKVINNKSFVNLRNDMNEVINQFKNIENDVNLNVYEKYQLHQYEQIIEGNDEDVIRQYETMYDKFAEIVINKNNAIQQSNDSINQINNMIEYIKKLTDTNNMNSIIIKEMNNANTMIKCLNQIVDKILEKETIIFNKKEQECEEQKQQRKQKFEEKQKDIKNMKYNCHNTEEFEKQQHIEEIKFKNDNELEQLNNSIESLLEWSNKQNYNIIFDSKIDGDGGNNVLKNKVINKRNLYFISFDNENNVFGGYMNEVINITDECIDDPKSFVFSLVRNGKVKNKKYDIKEGNEKKLFILETTRDVLYQFGYHGNADVLVRKIGSNSICDPKRYEYNGEQHPLRDNKDEFKMKRILVLEMN